MISFNIGTLPSGAYSSLQTLLVKFNDDKTTLKNLQKMSALKECLEKTDMEKVG